MIKQALNRSILFSLLLLLLICSSIAKADSQRVGPVKVSLISEQLSIKPGEPFEIGLYIEPDEHWHVYWENPGDAGLPPTLKFDLPDDFKVSGIQFPPPERIDLGPLTSYGYHGAVLYPVRVTPSENIKTGESLTLDLTAEWLVCKEECLPGMAKLSLTLPVKNETPLPNSQHSTLFESNRKIQPENFPETDLAQVSLTENKIYIDFKFNNPFSDSLKLQFYPSEKAIIKHSSEQVLTKVNDSYRLELERSPYSNSDPENLTGVLEIEDNDVRTNYNLSVGVGDLTTVSSATAATTDTSTTLLFALLFAFAGGLILNLMPCVLPVLSLKVLGLINQASHGRKNSFMHGLFFTFGVVASFWVIVALMFILQAGGAQLGWGFQLQSPTFVMILAAGMFLFGLSLFGVFEVSFLTGAAGSLSSAQKSGGLSSAFVSGITATLVATPCTAPFMGAALGYSLTQPIFISFMIYTSLALGMAAPYLVLAIFPNLLKFVPKPGAWMETLKQAMGFMLMATVIWLGWVLVSLAGANALVILLGVLLLVSIGAWICGRFGSIAASKKARLVSSTFAIILICSSIIFGHETISIFKTTTDSKEISTDGIQWEKFSQARLDELRSAGKPVFIDFTAAWCLSCQVNEQVALNTEDVINKLEELNITALKADWTNRSEVITRALASYGRNSVPVYVLYGTDSNAQPTMLPEILTSGIVLDALEKLEKDNNL